MAIMKLREKTGLIGGLVLTAVFIIAILTACAPDAVAPQASPPASASVETPEPLSSPAPTLYPEPSVKPSALPSSVKWNPYTGDWYDSAWVELDPVTHEYIAVPRTPPPGYVPPKVASITVKEWIEQHQDSTDEIDIAIIKYHQALIDYGNSLTEEERWHLGLRSDWSGTVGPAEVLAVLTDLGIPKLQGLLDRVQWENPFVVNLMIATNLISRRTITSGGDGGTDVQVAQWRQGFNDQAVSAREKVNVVARDLKSAAPDEKSIRKTFARLGILALPEVYELVINQGNTDLIQYLPDILPPDKMEAYNIQAGVTDAETLKQALADCAEDIKIIPTLHTD